MYCTSPSGQVPTGRHAPANISYPASHSVTVWIFGPDDDGGVSSPSDGGGRRRSRWHGRRARWRGTPGGGVSVHRAQAAEAVQAAVLVGTLHLTLRELRVLLADAADAVRLWSGLPGPG